MGENNFNHIKNEVENEVENELQNVKNSPNTSKKSVYIVYFVLRFLVIAVLIDQIYIRNWNNVFMCVLTLILFLIPAIVDRKFKIELPNTLEIIILLFIYAAEILGEIKEYYVLFAKWDDMLHTMNGFLCAAIGFAMIDILNRSDKVRLSMSPIYIGVVAFTFSMTVGVLWEFYEFFMDYMTQSDMQKDTIIPAISSILFNPEGANSAVTIPIKSIVVNGAPWNFGGYIDIGLYDTMHDLWVNCIGALVFSFIGVFYVIGRGKSKFAERFIPRLRKDSQVGGEVKE